MKKFLLISVIAVLVVFGVSTMALADFATVSVSAGVANVFTVGVTNPAVTFTLDDVAVIAGTPVAGSADPKLNVKSNKLFDVSQQAAAFVGSGAYVLPIDRMHYSITGAGTKADTAFTDTSVSLFPASARGNNDFTNHYTLRADIATDIPDTYTTTVTYTVVQIP